MSFVTLGIEAEFGEHTCFDHKTAQTYLITSKKKLKLKKDNANISKNMVQLRKNNMRKDSLPVAIAPPVSLSQAAFCHVSPTKNQAVL